MKRIYLDHNATTPLDPRVLEEMVSCLKECWGNPSALYRTGREARNVLDDAREYVAELINADPTEIFFTSGATESNNLAIYGTAYAGAKKGGHIITSAIEHSTVTNSVKSLMENGFEVSFIGVDHNGVLDLVELENMVRSDTRLISIMMANNDTGAIQPIKDISRIARTHKILFHTDAVQAVTKIPVDMQELQVDLMSLTAHKIYGPKGVGILYRRRGVEIAKLIWGGSQERRLRPGTENVPSIHGMGIACKIAMAEMNEINERITKIRDTFEDKLIAKFPTCKIVSQNTQRVGNTSNVIFPGLSGEFMALNLDLHGLEVSTGSACSALDKSPSPVLQAMGYSEEDAISTLRFSFGRANTLEEVDEIISRINTVMNQPWS